jgi:hypothetical protein
MGDSWSYTVFFAEGQSTALLQQAVSRALDSLHGSGLLPREGGVTNSVAYFTGTGEEATAAPSDLGQALTEVSGGVGFSSSALGASIPILLSVDTTRNALTYHLEGRPLEHTDSSRDHLARRQFLMSCANPGAVFGLGETSYSVEDLWANVYGIRGHKGLLDVGEEEVANVRAGRLPRVLPWISYFDERHFPGGAELLECLPSSRHILLGPARRLVQLSSGPWHPLFAKRHSDGGRRYEVVDRDRKSVV